MSKKVDFLFRMLLLIMLIMELYFIFVSGKYSLAFNAMLLILIIAYNYIKKENHKNEF